MTDVTFDTPFPAEEIKERPGRGGMTFSYVDAPAVMNRLDFVVGPGNWQTSYKVIKPDADVVECTLSVRIGGEWITKTDAGYPNSDNDDEPLKSAYSDALKRAAVQFGIGRHLREKAKRPQREAAPASPTTQKAFDQAELFAELAKASLVGADLVPVTGAGEGGKPKVSEWFRRNPDKRVGDLISEAKAKKEAV